MDKNKTVYDVIVNGVTTQVQTQFIPVYEKMFIPPYDIVKIDSIGMVTFTTEDDSGIVYIQYIDSGIPSDYWVPEDGGISECYPCYISVYNVAGRLITEYSLDIDASLDYIWDSRDSSGRKVASGVYFIKIQHNVESIYRKMVIIK